ncbi:hypothetical protein Pfo_007909 [Paulownia fortunei]|nr:hypothetical protein Pfo_007909 [Paulownia fortunei]
MLRSAWLDNKCATYLFHILELDAYTDGLHLPLETEESLSQLFINGLLATLLWTFFEDSGVSLLISCLYRSLHKKFSIHCNISQINWKILKLATDLQSLEFLSQILAGMAMTIEGKA